MIYGFASRGDAGLTGHDRGYARGFALRRASYRMTNAAMRWKTQNIATEPMAYGGRASAQRGQVFGTLARTAVTPRTPATNSSCPISTPTLKKNSATGMDREGRPTCANAPAKPKPCINPNVNETTHGHRPVIPDKPRRA